MDAPNNEPKKKGYIESLRAIIGNMRIMLPGCCVFIRNKAGQILMQQRTYPYGKWGLPGGLMELGESPEDTARREVLEETGLVLGKLELFGVYSGENYLCIAANGDEFQVVTNVYVTGDYNGDVAVMDDESLSFEWFDIDKLPDNIARTHAEIIRDYKKLY
ncbi:MAG: NUDIX hydrolase [Defluviitaleaceae bacterium]|nr:NUDIX hydrolase [Defluviitaleaceae bacterium]